MSSTTVREREQDNEDAERYSKRLKTEDDIVVDGDIVQDGTYASEPLVLSEPTTTVAVADFPIEEDPQVLPPSHALLGVPSPVKSEDGALNFLETDVGISEYIGRGEAKVEGIIKQRFTDFLVYEVDQDGNVIHLKSLGKPKSSKQESAPEPEAKSAQDQAATEAPIKEAGVESAPTENEPWPASFDEKLKPFLSDESREKLKAMFLEGPEAPLLSDSGWAGRAARAFAGDGEAPPPPEPVPEPPSNSGRGAGAGRGGRGRNRGGRGGGGGGGRPGAREDHRKIISEPMDSKDNRTAFHKIIRELFKGKLDTETDTLTPSDEGQRIVIKWGRGGRGGGQRSGAAAGSRPSRGNFPPYIHFTLQKTNRDTQDALGHLARNLHVNIKDLGVAGTKDKRGVTVQRVSVKRNGKHVEDIWRFANGIGPSRKPEVALTQRGDRGIRIGDLVYRKAGLELGMLKGNAFVITLRNVKVESQEVLDEAMTTIKMKGFINYYGMQRFGTASVPTHAIGLALLKSDWNRAISLILQKRHGEHPDVAAARDAWLVDRDVEKALSMLPRRVVAERCILESFKKMKGDTRNAMGALSTIPRNLRLMYIHAYQSYVWNAIVSERIKMHGADKPVVGDLVFEKVVEDDRMDVDEKEKEEEEEEEQGGQSGRRRRRKPYVAPRVKTLTEEDLDKYSIFDVIMPLPGTDVAYPGGKLGERYREFLTTDGLDPNNFVRRQKEYTLNGSYRAILHLPKELSWTVMRYTDPDVALAQSDEDQLLGFDAPSPSEDGKFVALQIRLQLGTAAYATMALREITKMDTSSHIQTSLTTASEDQKYRGTEAEAEAVEAAIEDEGELLEAVQ